jgi:cation:H+ antiporter
MFLALLLFIIGLIILIKGADWLVEGASSLALRFKINPMVIGLTIVAFGTSSPELVVSVTSALSGNTEIALGNIIGSNIMNILLVLGISAIVYPLTVNKNTVWKEIPMSFLGAVVMTILGLQNILDEKKLNMLTLGSQEVIGSITFSNGLILLSFFIIFLYYTFGIAKLTGQDKPDIQKMSSLRSVLFIASGLVALVLGSKLFVDNAVFLARNLGVSETFIGLTIVAMGTSAPELVTSVVAAYKKRVELAVGNIVGSNIFNIFLILGITSLVKTIPLTVQNMADIIVLFLATLILFISLFVYKRHRIARPEGAFMVACYIAYVIFLILRG